MIMAMQMYYGFQGHKQENKNNNILETTIIETSLKMVNFIYLDQRYGNTQRI